MVHSNCHPLGQTGELSCEAAFGGQWGSVVTTEVTFCFCVVCSHGQRGFFESDIDPTVSESCTAHTARYCRLLTAYTVTYFIAKRN